MNYLKKIVLFFVLLIMLTVLFADGPLKGAAMTTGLIGFVILLANLVNSYRVNRRR